MAEDKDKDKESCCCHEEHEHHEHECCHHKHDGHNEHEHGCGCCHHHDHEHHGEEQEDPKKEIIKIVVGTVLLVAGLLAKHFELPIYIYYVLMAASYVVLGWEVAVNAITNLFHGEFFDENFLMFIATVGAAALGEYTEAVSVMLFYDIGEFAQDSIAEK